MSAEFPSLFSWFIVLQVLAWGTFPIAYSLFPSFPDRGYALAKIQGLLFSAYLSWLLASLNLLPYGRGTAWLSLVGVLAVSLKLALSHRQELLKFLRRKAGPLVFVEVLFLSAYLLFAFIRTYNPDITGAEKEPDFTFLNAILRSESFPPPDTWFAGESLNYYYFGYLIWAHVIKLSGVSPPIGFNLAVATLVALSMVGAFSLGFNLTGRVRYGLFTAFLLCIAGNLDGFIQWLERGKLVPFDWWRSSRVIPDTINEFPFFSFLLGDLHAHFMSIPFALLFLSLLYELTFITAKDLTRRHDTGAERPRKLFSSAPLFPFCISLGAASFLNSWDFPTYLLLTLLGFFTRNLPLRHTLGIPRMIGRTLLIFLGVSLVSYLLYLPFHLSFTSQVSLADLRWVSSSQRTGLWPYLIIYGFFLFILITFSLYKFRQMLSPLSQDARSALLGGLLLSFPILHLLFNSWVIPLMLPFTLLFLMLWLQEKGSTSPQEGASRFSYLLIFVATAILIGCELVYIKDFYAHPLERQNTIFKFYYQVWILLSIGTPYLLYEIHTPQGKSEEPLSPYKTYWDYAFMLLLLATWIYPIWGTYEKCNRFIGAGQGGLPYIPTLDGTAYIRYRYPAEYKAITWLQENLTGRPVILEATGKPYSFYGRVSSNTGFPTVLGWGNHEALWRDQTWKSILERTRDIQTIYTMPDKSEVLDLLKKYQVQYVYVGLLEAQSYNPLGLDGFKKAFAPIYNQEGVVLYKVPP